MAEIMKHPFCQRQQDTDSGRRLNLVEPPRMEEIARPVRSEREIDRDILRNLRTLWNGTSEKEIVQSLLSHECVAAGVPRSRELTAKENMGKGVLLFTAAIPQ